MKITLITAHFAPHFEGGTEFVARSQARELSRRGHEVRIVSGTDRTTLDDDRKPDEDGSEVLTERVDGLPVTFLPRTPVETYDLALDRPRLARRVARELAGSDLVHLHHWWTLSGSLVRDTTRSMPVVVTLHDAFTTCPRFFRVSIPSVERCPEPGDFEPCARCCAPDAPGLGLPALEDSLRARSRAFRAELAAAARIVVPSRAHAEALSGYLDLDPDKTTVVPHGLCAEMGESPAPAPFTKEGPLRVLFLGHLSEVKGVSDLVRALRGLERTELLLLGEEVEPGFVRKLEQESERSGGPPITFGGGYRVEDLSQRVADLGGAHLVALPSRVRESYGLVVDEAQALGLPVWVSDRGAPKERVGAGGRVLPAEDPGAWHDSFAEVLRTPAILDAERRAAPVVSRTAADAALALEDLYREILRGR